MTFPALDIALPLALVCALAFAVETALGFGAALITVALGSFLVDLGELLPAFVPLNLCLSLYLVSRYHRDVDRGYFLRRLLPGMALGMPVGLFVFSALDASLLKRLFGLFVVLAASLELWRLREAAPRRALGPAAALAMLFAGGVVHGAFSTGGPMAVYVTGRVIEDKARYRATLSALWAVLGTVLVATYAATGRITAATGSITLILVPSILLGMVLGEAAFRRVPVGTFRRVVFATLIVSGAMLAVRG